MKKVHEISLDTMIVSKNKTIGMCHFSGEGEGTQEVDIKNGELVIKADGDIECMQTAESYTLPLKIDMTVKTDSTNIRMFYKLGEVVINWECCKDELRIHDILLGNDYGYSNKGLVPDNEFVDISWIIEKKHIDVYVNGELRLHADEYPYIGLLLLEPDRIVSEPFRVSAGWGSTITVKSIKITEL